MLSPPAPVAVLEADGVGRDRQVPPPGEFSGVRLAGIAAQPYDLALAEVELASVLVMTEDDRHATRHCARDAQEGRSPAARHVVGNSPAQVTIALHLGQDIDTAKDRRPGRPEDDAQ